LIEYDRKSYLSQFVSEMFGYWQKDSAKCTPQYECNSLIAMATYWVPDFPNFKAFLATVGVKCSYLQMVPHLLDPASI